ncbi:ribosomal RNA processing protein 1 homolog B [Pteropus vampyrus]|uniref:Ribosomal RNA processing protein 1 homolog B n=1 Tax=Pteropus vampyrus TaxID=132908 RepID=A0A6P6BUY8_PTEVA|nr:ribosomal RNA processing protein 1 homolog B [Pteropus vampyrus]
MQYLRAEPARQPVAQTPLSDRGFSQEELLKIWKGLFYCMWVQDEPLLQEELARTISQLIHVVNTPEAQHLFVQTFWQTMNREWTGIDRLRLDKYCMLIRLDLRQCFEVLNRDGWEESCITRFLDVLMKEVLHPESRSPDGVKFHCIDVYLDELSKVGGKELLADQNLKFIDPFCKIVAKTKDHTLVQTIAKAVFEVIVDQSPFVPEETVEEQEALLADSNLFEEGTSEREVTWKTPFSKKKTALGKCHSKKDGIGDEGERDGGGSLEDAGPLLQFDYKAVADRLLEITNRRNIPPFNKKRLSKLIKKFQDLSEAGSIPQLRFAEDISADEDSQTLSQGRYKKKGNKLLEKTNVERQKGEIQGRALLGLVWDTATLSCCSFLRVDVARVALCVTCPFSPFPQGSPGALSPLKKKLRAEDDFVKFDTPFLPKPVFFRKAKSSAAAPAGSPPAQVSKTPPGSKKVTFGLSRNMTAEFKKTDKSILVSPTGPSRVAFNPEQKPLHGVLKTPTSSPISTLLGTKKPLTTAPRRRPTAMDFF